MKGLKFILIDDNETFRNCLRLVLESKYDAKIIAEASNAEEVKKITNLNHADIILMDVMMPGKSGIELTKELLWQNNRLKIVAITLHNENVYLTSLLSAGFKGCIFKDDLWKQLDEVLTTVWSGAFSFPRQMLIDHN